MTSQIFEAVIYAAISFQQIQILMKSKTTIQFTTGHRVQFASCYSVKVNTIESWSILGINFNYYFLLIQKGYPQNDFEKHVNSHFPNEN